MTYCTECGKGFRKATQYCTNCGTVNENFQSKTPEPQSRLVEKLPNKSRKSEEDKPGDIEEYKPKGGAFGALIFVSAGLALILLVISVVASFSHQTAIVRPTPVPSLSSAPAEVDFSIYSDKELCERFPKEAKKLGKNCSSETSVADEKTNETASPEPTKEVVRAGYEAMAEALNQLNEDDPDGFWLQDTFENSSPLIAGVLLDNYSDYPEGCAAWFFDTEADSEKALDRGVVNLFSDFYTWWIYETGPALIVVANSEFDACYQNITEILELSD